MNLNYKKQRVLQLTCQLATWLFCKSFKNRPTMAPRNTTQTLSGRYANFDLIRKCIAKMQIAVGQKVNEFRILY